MPETCVPWPNASPVLVSFGTKLCEYTTLDEPLALCRSGISEMPLSITATPIPAPFKPRA